MKSTDGWTCQDLGYVGWNFDPRLINEDTPTTVTSGNVLFSEVKTGGVPFSNVTMQLDVLLATPTWGQNYIGVWDATSKALLAQSFDQTAAWVKAGNKEKLVTAALTTGVLAAFQRKSVTEVGKAVTMSSTEGIEPGMAVEPITGVVAASTYVESVTSGTEIQLTIAAEKAEAGGIQLVFNGTPTAKQVVSPSGLVIVGFYATGTTKPRFGMYKAAGGHYKDPRCGKSTGVAKGVVPATLTELVAYGSLEDPWFGLS